MARLRKSAAAIARQTAPLLIIPAIPQTDVLRQIVLLRGNRPVTTALLCRGVPW